LEEVIIMIDFDKIAEFNKKLRSPTINGTVAMFVDEHVLLDAARKTYAAGFRKFDTLSPFPIHGMDDAIGLKRSPVPWFTMVAGTVGCAFALWLQCWISAVSWPVNVGGKPFYSIPAFIPITFEMTVLFGALTTVAGMLWLCGLPKVDPPIIDPDITSHKFAIFVPESDHGYEDRKVQDLLKSFGAVEVRKTEF
jgi:hypothetical protein